MSVTAIHTDLDVRAHRSGDVVIVRAAGALVLRNAPEARRTVAGLVADLDGTTRLVVDLTSIDDLDTAGIAAVTAPAFAGLRAGHDVSVLPPLEGAARLLADRVGVFPIGRG